jgi:tRNA 2-thiouridine synthesizing protein E
MTKAMGVLRDTEGYLVNPEDWDETIAHQLAAEEGLTLNEAYWPVLKFMREYWTEHRIAPDVRHAIARLADTHGIDKKAAKDQLFKLFPYGYVKQACKIAGMQRPRVWSTG